LTSTGTNVSNNDYVYVGAKKYTFKTTLTTEGDIQIGATALETLTNFIRCINHIGTNGTAAGSNYYCSVADTNVYVRDPITAIAATDDDVTNDLAGLIVNNVIVTLTAKAFGTGGNNLDSTKSAATLNWGAAKFAGGANNAINNVRAGDAVNGTQLLQATTVANGGIPVDASGDLNITAAAVATDIIANTASGFTASSSGQTVTITSLTDNTTQNNMAVSVGVPTGSNVCIGQCLFYFAGTGFTLDYIKANTVNILSAVLTFPTGGETLAAFVTRAAANINAYTGTSGYVAYANQTHLFVSKQVTSSSDGATEIDISVTPAGGTGTVTAELTTLAASATPSSATFISNGKGGGYSTTFILATGTGGSPPYTYAWQIVSNELQNGEPKIDNTNNSVTTFSTVNTSWKGMGSLMGSITVQCVVTDFKGVSTSTNIVTIGVAQ
jgi:hypothetical protein